MDSTNTLVAADSARARSREAEDREPAAPAGSAASAESAAPPARKPLAFIPRAVIAVLAPLLVVTAIGLPYYVLPLSERLWHPLHAWFKPAGYVGQAAGFLALGLFLFLWLYPLRKRFRWLGFSGTLAQWLDVHIIAGVSVPLVGAIHASWRFTGLIGAGYGAMLLVAVSGLIGRYLYVRIPRARDGRALRREQIATERRELVGNIVVATGLSSERVLRLLAPTPAPTAGLVSTLRTMIGDDFARRRAIRGLIRDWKRSAATKPPSRKELRRIGALARREMEMSQQVRILDATNKVFRFWHLAHQPFAITAFLAVAVHVTVVIAFGATWIR